MPEKRDRSSGANFESLKLESFSTRNIGEYATAQGVNSNATAQEINSAESMVNMVESIFNHGSLRSAGTSQQSESSANCTETEAPFRAEVKKTQQDALGYQHVRYAQTCQGIPVAGAELIVHVDSGSNVYQINGSYLPADTVTGLSFTPGIDAEAALQVGLEELKEKTGVEVRKEPALVVFGGHLAYHYELAYKLTSEQEPGRWVYYVDAHTGNVLMRYNNIQYAAPVEADGSHDAVAGWRLKQEDGERIIVTGFHETEGSGNFFLYNFDELWGIFDWDEWDWEQLPIENWWTFDRAAISAAKNFEDVQDYVRNVLGMDSYDDNGAFCDAAVHVGDDYSDAYWDGKAFYFGDGDGVVADPLTSLDIVANEYGHALTEYTSNLYYYMEPGALNEVYSSIFSCAVEFHVQPDGTAAYPDEIDGHSDWLLFEDCWLETKAWADVRDPQRFGMPSYYMGTNWYQEPNGWWQDWWGDDWEIVHTNCGVGHFAYYLLAEGGSGVNDGHAYGPITGIGQANAAAVALRANFYYHTATDTYVNAREHWISAAEDLGFNTATVEQVWDACGVFPCETTYRMDDRVNYSFEDISATGTKLDIGDDDYVYFSIPFTFEFYCRDYDKVSVGDNGGICFVDTTLDYEAYPIPYPFNWAMLSTFIAPLWADIDGSAGGAIYYQVKGSAPARRLIVQWEQVPYWEFGGGVTFQAILYEGSNKIVFQYKDVEFGFEDPDDDNGGYASVGIQGNTNVGVQYSCFEPVLHNEMAIRFIPTRRVTAVIPAVGFLLDSNGN